MENLSAVVVAWINSMKPYAITAGAAFVAGFIAHWTIF